MASNSFGTLFRFTTWGESHGTAIGVVIDGCPPLIPLTETDIQPALDRRRPGQSKFTTQRQEADQVRILSGVFEGITTGAPISMMIDNTDAAKYGIRDYRGGGRSSAREMAGRVAAGAVAQKILGAGVRIRGGVV